MGVVNILSRLKSITLRGLKIMIRVLSIKNITCVSSCCRCTIENEQTQITQNNEYINQRLSKSSPHRQLPAIPVSDSSHF